MLVNLIKIFGKNVLATDILQVTLQDQKKCEVCYDHEKLEIIGFGICTERGLSENTGKFLEENGMVFLLSYYTQDIYLELTVLSEIFLSFYTDLLKKNANNCSNGGKYFDLIIKVKGLKNELPVSVRVFKDQNCQFTDKIIESVIPDTLEIRMFTLKELLRCNPIYLNEDRICTNSGLMQNLSEIIPGDLYICE